VRFPVGRIACLGATALTLSAATPCVRYAEADSACPPDTMSLAIECSPNPIVSVSTEPGTGWGIGTGDGTGAGTNYDLLNGHFRANAGAHGSGTQNCAQAILVASDTYVVQGLPIGSPLTFEAVLHIGGSADPCCGSASCSALITDKDSGANSGAGTSSGSPAIDTTVELPLAYAVGDPFTLSFKGLALAQASNGNIAASVSFELSFLDLPAEATVVSCQGFHQGPTSSRGGTWGAVKVRYR